MNYATYNTLALLHQEMTVRLCDQKVQQNSSPANISNKSSYKVKSKVYFIFSN
jgi:hypothetical protein